MKNSILIIIALVGSSVYLNCNGVDYIAQKLPSSVTKKFATRQEALAYNKGIENALLKGAALYGAYKVGSWAYKRWNYNDVKHIQSLFETIKKLSNEIQENVLKHRSRVSFYKSQDIRNAPAESIAKAESIATIINHSATLYFIDTLSIYNKYSPTFQVKKLLDEKMHNMEIIPIKSYWYARLYNNIWAQNSLKHIEHLFVKITALTDEINNTANKVLKTLSPADTKKRLMLAKAKAIAYIVQKSILLYSSDKALITDEKSIVKLINTFLKGKIQFLQSKSTDSNNAKAPNFSYENHTPIQSINPIATTNVTDTTPTPIKKEKNEILLKNKKEKWENAENKRNEDIEKNPPRYTLKQIAQQNLILRGNHGNKKMKPTDK